jgi:hypothetical protein
MICRRRNRRDDSLTCATCLSRLGFQLREIPGLHALLPSALSPGQTGTERVSGSHEAPVPVDVDVVDLLGAARQPEPSQAGRQHPEDHIGHLSVASVLDQWVRDWRDIRARGEGIPAPTVTALAGWLHVRLDWACDHHLAIDEFDMEIRHLADAMRTALALRRYVVRLQAPCPTCDTRALYREVDPQEGAAEYITCGGCGRLWRPEEYARLATILVDEDGRAA